jgi:ankyrin repeat protein
LAAEHGFQNLVQVLLDNGADVDGRDNKGRTALHLAAMNGHIEIVKKLLEKGADPSVVNRFGRTAEYWAKQNGHTRVEHLLHLAKLKNQGAAQAQAKKVAGSSQQTAAVKETKPLTRITSKPQQKDDQFTDPSVLRWD